MADINDYREEKSCIYKGEEYLVRDNGAVLRKSRPNQRTRKHDDMWTFGDKNETNGYGFFFGSGHRIHQIVATAFHGAPSSKEYIVDHIDTNRQNNRPTNLRWITRLENVVLNEVTRKRIEYRIGVSIYEFLENPAKYREAFDDTDFSWMRRVSEEEARICLENVKRWVGDKKESLRKQNSKLGEWIFKSQHNEKQDIGNAGSFLQTKRVEEKTDIIDSLTPMAKQKNWKIPTKFVCCPNNIDGDPILCYLKNLHEDANFTENQYGKSTIVKYASVDNKAIVIITSIPSSIKPLALVNITYENGYYLHTSLGSFITDEGAEKQFTLSQGLEWTGGDSIDDYC